MVVKYLMVRIIIVLMAVVIIHFTGNYIGENSEEQMAFMENASFFYRGILLLAIGSAVFFSVEAYRFQQQQKLKLRNAGFVLIALVVLPVILLFHLLVQFL